MSINITMPALSPTMEEGNLAKWLVKVGDHVEPGQVIAEIETDKATMEVEAVDEGVVSAILVPEGSEGVKVNTPIAVLAGEGEAPAPAKQAKAPASPPAGEAAPKAAEGGRAEKVAPAPSAQRLPPPTPSPQGGGGRVASSERLAASPLARRMAQAAGIDLSGLAGSGPHGRIVKRDIEGAMQGSSGAPRTERAAPAAESRALAISPPAPAPVKSLEQMGVAAGSYDLVPLDLMRKTIARRMTDSFRDIPHFPLTIDLEIDKLLAARGDINKRFADQGVKVSVNDMIIKACALALIRTPAANASYTPEGIAMHHHADVAVAVAIPGGLITPIVRAAETKGLAQISAEMADLAERARTKKLKPEEYQGGTFSLSNMGMLGIKTFSSILNEPHGMIMSVGSGEKRPIVKNDALAIATIMSVTLTCDHRVVDGAIGAAFLKAFRGFIEDPMSMLL
ncbi:MAG: pyruvate dehydrogenase complex dihydrolipoamide acetyltransferase [Hyphomonadaceae bacterium]|nr:pyruvate dehydrogenase complex dihydrolipoamide acetyltransferase [Hyphomonadaceae bacterium]